MCSFRLQLVSIWDSFCFFSLYSRQRPASPSSSSAPGPRHANQIYTVSPLTVRPGADRQHHRLPLLVPPSASPCLLFPIPIHKCPHLIVSPLVSPLLLHNPRAPALPCRRRPPHQLQTWGQPPFPQSANPQSRKWTIQWAGLAAP